MTIGEQIRNFRESRNLTQEELGKLAGYCEMTIWKYENDRFVTPSLYIIKDICDLMGITVDEMLRRCEK